MTPSHRRFFSSLAVNVCEYELCFHTYLDSTWHSQAQICVLFQNKY